jgi:hypothetical protein
VAIRVTKDNGQFARADVDYLDADGQVIARVQDYECVIDRRLDQAFRSRSCLRLFNIASIRPEGPPGDGPGYRARPVRCRGNRRGDGR